MSQKKSGFAKYFPAWRLPRMKERLLEEGEIILRWNEQDKKFSKEVNKGNNDIAR